MGVEILLSRGEVVCIVGNYVDVRVVDDLVLVGNVVNVIFSGRSGSWRSGFCWWGSIFFISDGSVLIVIFLFNSFLLEYGVGFFGGGVDGKYYVLIIVVVLSVEEFWR